MANPINSVFTDDDRVHMRAALSLAKRAVGTVAPNPAVGCVLFRPDLGDKGRVVGRGFTQPGGRPHAETKAIDHAGDLASGAHAYVTLEPCNHKGQTGPCTEALIDAGIRTVTVALTDPDPRVQGGGIERIKDAGLEVRTGLLEDDARAINAGFLSVQERGRPWVTLKVATSADGMIAAEKGVPLWITGAAARARGHLIRAQNDAILTGVGTVMADNPQMNCRLPGLEHRSPHRFVIDPQARMSPDAEILKPLNGTKTVVFRGKGADTGLLAADVEIIPQPMVGGRFDILSLLRTMANSGMTRVMVEAGQGVNDAFLSSGLIDEIAWFRAPTNIGPSGISAFSRGAPDNSPDFERVSTIDLDGDQLERYLRVV
jgi:diaminohydroxyphosphoribosylaminopyrimidine deaminase/5-amino-6-(5-phosphoribosylamino)uracil reductase